MHNPVSVAGELSAKLATRSRHVCLLVGAGASVGAGLPDLSGLTAKVLEAVTVEDDRKLLVELLKGRNLEQAMTRLRRVQSLLESDEKVSGLDKELAARLDAKICEIIIGSIRAPKNVEAFRRLGSWASRADYRGPIEIFSANYDLLVEIGLELVGASYFDGFVGHLKAAFRPDLVESMSLNSAEHLPATFVRLWKLHGSSNWVWETSGGHRRVVRLGDHAPPGSAVAVFPSDEKYDDSRRVPFVVLMDRFRRALAEPETLLLVSGFSFGDQHLNEIIFDSARRRPRSEFVLFCHDTIPAAVKSVALETKNITVMGATEAVVGGHVAPWAADDDVPGIAVGGRCLLGDFGCLAAFLDRQNQPNETSAI